MGAESGKTLQKWTKEQVYDRITFLYVKEWKIMRLIDADAEIEKMSEEMTRAMAEIARWERRKTDADTTLYDIEAKIVQLQKNIVDCNKEIKILRLYNTAYDVEAVVKELEDLKMSYFLTLANTGDADKDCAYLNTANAIDKAIEIVKRGGRGEE